MAVRTRRVTKAQAAALVKNPDVPDPVKIPVEIVASTAAPVTLVQKLKGYYKGLIALIGSLLIVVNQVTPILHFLPAEDVKYVNLVIGILTVAGTFLKENEHWVDSI